MTEADGRGTLRNVRDEYRDFAHTGPGTLAGRFMRRFWHPVAIAEDLPAGRAITVKLMSEEFTLYRGESGRVHAVGHRCAHRGTKLSVGWVEGDCIRCLYHGWKYDETGQCIEQPGEEVAGAGFARKVKIPSFRAEEYLGLVFAYIGEGAAPPLPRYPAFEDEGVIVTDWYTRKCNFFQNIENSIDEVHVYFTHRQSFLTEGRKFMEAPRISATETDYGIRQVGTRRDGSERVTHLIMPNILHMRLPPREREATEWNKYISWRVPLDDESHRSFIVQLVHVTGAAAARVRATQKPAAEREAERRATEEATDAMLAEELTWADIADHPGLVNIQDNVSQIGQGRIADRTNEWLGRSDTAIILLRILWEREMRALAEGAKPTAWRTGLRLETTSGE